MRRGIALMKPGLMGENTYMGYQREPFLLELPSWWARSIDSYGFVFRSANDNYPLVRQCLEGKPAPRPVLSRPKLVLLL